MKTIALRFSDRFAPPIGTIGAHLEMINRFGFVWYGKLGSVVSAQVCKDILENDSPRILLIHSGQTKRYWAFIDQISKDTPELSMIPQYYRDMANDFHTWFRVRSIEEAAKGVMSACVVTSSGMQLSRASRHSMSP